MKFKNANILIVGDLMIDHYLYGTVDRICPEAPVPVLNCKSEESFLGGAGIVLTNLLQLGANATLISVAGNDEDGGKLKLLLKGINANPETIAIESGRKTIIKTRCVATSPFWQMLLRFDNEKTDPVRKDTENMIKQKFSECLDNADVVVFSDYKKGMLNPSLIKGLMEMAKKCGKTIVTDSKGRIFEYKGTDVIAPNRVELCNAYEVKPTNDDKIIVELSKKLAKDMGCAVLVKRSEKGVLVVSNGQEKTIPATAKKIVNVSGAGDVFIASLSLALASGNNVMESARIANYAAGIAIGRTRPHVTLDDFNGFK